MSGFLERDCNMVCQRVVEECPTREVGVVFARAWCKSSLDVPQDFLKHHKHRKRYFFLRTAMLLAFQVPADSKCLALRDLGVSRALPTSLHEKLL